MTATGAETRRLGLALGVAVAFHAALILPDAHWPVPTAAVDGRPLELILTRTDSGQPEAGDDAHAAVPAPAPAEGQRQGQTTVRSAPSPAEPSSVAARRADTQPEAEQRTAPPEASASQPEVRRAAPESAAATAQRTDTPSAEALRQTGLNLAANLDRTLADTAGDGLRRKYVRAGSADLKYSGYIRGWVAKIERVGRMNYPQRALKEGLSGELLMSVGIAADGSLESIELRRSSGYPILDEAARRIVRLCAPYSPLPEAIAAETDVLYITRNWKFLPHGGLK